VPSFGKLSRSATISRKSTIPACPLNSVGRGAPVECRSWTCSSPRQEIPVKQLSSTRDFHSQSPKSLPSIVSTRNSAPTRLAGSAASLSLQPSQIDRVLPLPTPSHVAETAKRIQIAFDSLSAAPPEFVLSQPHVQPATSRASHTNLRSTARPAPPGIFSLPGLTSPSSFRDLARRAVARGGAIVDRVVATADNPAELAHIVKRLDRLSDEVCAVVDAAEVVRSLHPEAEWRDAADEAHGEVSALLNRLNTHRELYEALDRATSNPSISRTWSPTELRVAHLLLADFRRSGIYIRDPAKLSLFASLNDRILALSHKVARGANEPAEPFVFFSNPWKDLAGCGSPFIREKSSTPTELLSSQLDRLRPTYFERAGTRRLDGEFMRPITPLQKIRLVRSKAC
ncbi:zincin, partial [Gonapodya prolifera JEL478]